ncbi:WhiB family transcriptional regulator [Mycobacterium tuberculosis]|nr:WhiB family transcriptional regulator [Mycobacterium tuberculosis]
MAHPCATDPELWFGYPDDDGSDGAAKARAYERSATQARIQCLRRCPLLQQRRCAQHAVEHRVEYGVWAGIKLPGGQYRKREQLAAAHDVLRRIAGGEINSRQLPDNAALLARNEGLEVTPVPGVVVPCRSHRLAHNRPLDARSASPAVAKPSVIRLGSRVRRRSGSPDHLPSARICVSSRRSPRRLLWCYRRPLARCSESTIR